MDNLDLEKRLSLVISRLSIINYLEAHMDCFEIEGLKKSLLSLFLSNLSKKQIKYDLAKLNILDNLIDVLEDRNIDLDPRSISNVSNIVVEIAREFKENKSEYFNSIIKSKELEIEKEEEEKEKEEYFDEENEIK